MNWEGHSLPGGARLRSDCPYHISIYDNMDRRTQAVGNVPRSGTSDSASRQPAYKECRRAPILLCSQSLEPFSIPGCSLIHTRKTGGIVLKGVDLENGALRLVLRLVVSSKHIYTRRGGIKGCTAEAIRKNEVFVPSDSWKGWAEHKHFFTVCA
jgi:hypothetical protein